MNGASSLEFTSGEGALERNALLRVASPSAFDLIKHNVDQFLFLAVLRVAFPNLLISDDMVLLAEQARITEASAFPTITSSTGRERLINHIHLWDLIKSDSFGPSVEMEILDRIKGSWEWWIPLKSGRKVSIFTEGGEGSYGPSITFSTYC
jgi:hypothetical protein